MVQIIQINNTVENLTRINQLTAVAKQQADTIFWAYIIGFILAIGLIIYVIIRIRKWYFKHYVWCNMHTSPTTFESLRYPRKKTKSFEWRGSEYNITQHLIKNSSLEYIPGVPNPIEFTLTGTKTAIFDTGELARLKNSTVIEKFKLADDFMGTLRIFLIVIIILVCASGFIAYLASSTASDAKNQAVYANAQLQYIINKSYSSEVNNGFRTS